MWKTSYHFPAYDEADKSLFSVARAKRSRKLVTSELERTDPSGPTMSTKVNIRGPNSIERRDNIDDAQIIEVFKMSTLSGCC
jgi:hypothetical protein